MESNTEKIERYLLEKMTPEEKLTFEQDLKLDPNLKIEFEAQSALMEGIKHIGLRLEITKVIREIQLMKSLTTISIILAVALSVGIGVYLLSDKSEIQPATNQPVPKEIHTPTESFVISSKKDTIIESPGGLMIAIPEGAFDTQKEEVRIEIQEALTELDIIKSGLSTTSNGDLLQSAGMFSVKAFDGKDELDWKKALTVLVPTDEINRNMMLFEGETQKDGTINWVNPQQLNNDLHCLPISELGFYPENFLPTLQSLGENIKNKKYTDSVYYSFSGYIFMNIQVSDEFGGGHSHLLNADQPFEEVLENAVDSTTTEVVFSEQSSNELDPSRIQAFWNKEFDNTLLATKEFEERLRFIHTTCNPKFLEAYVQHLDWPLWQIDSLCMTIANGFYKQKFAEFYSRKDRGVKLDSELSKKLNLRYKTKQESYKKAMAQVWKAHARELDSLRTLAIQKNQNFKTAELLRGSTVFADELCRNLKDAYSQIGVSRDCENAFPKSNSYQITLNTPGWKNLDQYVFATTTNRESMRYTDPVSGKVATLTYTPAQFTIEKENDYDKVFLYLIPDSLSSFQRILKKDNEWKEKLNSNLNFRLVAVAYKGEELYWTKINDLKPDSYSLKFESGTEAEIEKHLKSRPNAKSAEIKSELEFRRFQIKESIRVERVKDKAIWRRKIAESIFTCLSVPVIPSPEPVQGGSENTDSQQNIENI